MVMKKISSVITILSLLIICFSFTLSAYTNEEDFQEKYMAIDWQELGSRAASDEFYKLKDKYLSNKYKFQDYGFTFLIIGIAGLIVFRKGGEVYSPSSKSKVVLLGFGAAFLTVVAYVGDLFLEFFRNSYPWWADSLGIPLMGIPILAIAFFAWAALNMLALNGKFNAGVRIVLSRVKGSNYFYLTLIVLTLVVLLLCIIDGYFWLLLPSILWLYFYVSLWSGRYAASNAIY